MFILRGWNMLKQIKMSLKCFASGSSNRRKSSSRGFCPILPRAGTHTARRGTRVYQHWVLTNTCHARNASPCCSLSLSFPISSLAAPRDCTGANVDGQQGRAVAIVACDGAETSCYAPGLTAQQRGGGSLQEGQGRALKISWSRTTQTWNHLTKQSLPFGQENYPNSKNITLFFPILFFIPTVTKSTPAVPEELREFPTQQPEAVTGSTRRDTEGGGLGHNLLSE